MNKKSNQFSANRHARDHVRQANFSTFASEIAQNRREFDRQRSAKNGRWHNGE